MTDCSIAEDLLPLYNEKLLQKKTTKWLETHLENCPACAELAKKSAKAPADEPISSPIDEGKMISNIMFRLSFYQIIFVGLSFFLAIRTSLLNDSFGFILSYTVLGLVMFLFYKNIKIIILVAFLPVFIWSLWTVIQDVGLDTGPFYFLMDGLIGSLTIAIIHLAFALIGAVIGGLILKLKGSEKQL